MFNEKEVMKSFWEYAEMMHPQIVSTIPYSNEELYRKYLCKCNEDNYFDIFEEVLSTICY